MVLILITASVSYKYRRSSLLVAVLIPALFQVPGTGPTNVNAVNMAAPTPAPAAALLPEGTTNISAKQRLGPVSFSIHLRCWCNRPACFFSTQYQMLTSFYNIIYFVAAGT